MTDLVDYLRDKLAHADDVVLDDCPSCGSMTHGIRHDVYRRHADAEVECDHSWHDAQGQP